MSPAHAHAHAHPHDHHHLGQQVGGAAGAGSSRRLAIVLAFTAAYTVAEAVGGYVAHSLALLADAGHMLSDVAALALSLFAAWVARRPATPRRSFGYYRTEILAAMVNGATLIAISLYVFVEAFRRLRAPPEVHGVAVMAIAAGGFAMNVLGMVVLSAGRRESLNVHGAWLHVATDALGNLGTVLAGALVAFLSWTWADPVASILIGILVIYSSWALVRESIAVLMESAPRGVDPDAVREAMLAVAGVRGVHDLHIWSITSGLDALSAHVAVDDTRADRDVLPELCVLLRERFGIDHATLQLEAECSAAGTLHS